MPAAIIWIAKMVLTLIVSAIVCNILTRLPVTRNLFRNKVEVSA